MNFIHIRTKNCYFLMVFSADSFDAYPQTNTVLEDYAAQGTGIVKDSFWDFCLTIEETNSYHEWSTKCFCYQSDMCQDDCSCVSLMHKCLPYFKGRWIPCLNDDASADLYCTMVLLLLNPWCTLQDFFHEC